MFNKKMMINVIFKNGLEKQYQMISDDPIKDENEFNYLRNNIAKLAQTVFEDEISGYLSLTDINNKLIVFNFKDVSAIEIWSE